MMALGAMATPLLKANAHQVEALRRWRGGGQQHVHVERVHVSDGGQAVIGNIQTSVEPVAAGSKSLRGPLTQQL